MSNPQQPELARSRKTPAQDQDAVAGVLDGQRDIGADAPRGPVPAENQPGHHPAEEQDKPDVNAFAAKLGTMPPDERQEWVEQQEAEQPAGAPAASRSRVVAIAAAAVGVVVALFAVRRRRSRR
jgi:MYXO-CTERM domain-containing protein